MSNKKVIWKSGGPADKKLIQMLESGGIHPSMSPVDAKKLAVEFQPFSLDVFRNHFKMEKVKLGEHLPNTENEDVKPMTSVEKKALDSTGKTLKGKFIRLFFRSKNY